MTTGEKIAKCRKQNNLTQGELAQKLEVTRQAVSRWEGDLAFPETDTLIKLGKLFGVSVDWLLNYNEQSEPENAEAEKPKADTRLSWSFDLSKLYFEYKSKTHIGSLPLVHVNLGFGRTAKGVFAIGLASIGIFSFGIFSLGIISIGVFCLGLISLASISAGVFAAGAVSVGCIALGGCAVGLFSMGGCAVGLFACGGYASGAYVAVGDFAVGGIALGDTSSNGSILSVLKPQFNEMESLVNEKLKDIPGFWRVFTEWSRGLMYTFMKS